jgi:hypothetical protein
MKFDTSKIYYIHTSPATFGKLPQSTITDILSDGRYSSPFTEALINDNFDNISYKTGNKSDDFAFNDGSEKPLEQRGYSLKAIAGNKPINLIPSNMIGAGRKYDETKYRQKLESISAFLIVYPLQQYQHQLIFSLPSSKVMSTTPLQKSINHDDIASMLGATPEQIYQDILKMSIDDDVMYEFDSPWASNLRPSVSPALIAEEQNGQPSISKSENSSSILGFVGLGLLTLAGAALNTAGGRTNARVAVDVPSQLDPEEVVEELVQTY